MWVLFTWSWCPSKVSLVVRCALVRQRCLVFGDAHALLWHGVLAGGGFHRLVTGGELGRRNAPKPFAGLDLLRDAGGQGHARAAVHKAAEVGSEGRATLVLGWDLKTGLTLAARSLLASSRGC